MTDLYKLTVMAKYFMICEMCEEATDMEKPQTTIIPASLHDQEEDCYKTMVYDNDWGLPGLSAS